MSKTRRKHSAEFKVKVVLDMLKGIETLAEISSKYGVHPTQITKWRRTFLEKAPAVFGEKSSRQDHRRDEVETELYKKIGQLQVELDFLKKKSGIYL
jgi:transposase-like protein